MSTLIDKSPSRGVYYGDLAYGRADGEVYKPGRDFVACLKPDGTPTNMPCNRLVLVKPRDPAIWKKDPAIKEAKKRRIDGSQHAANVVMSTFKDYYDSGYLRSNIHLRVGKSMF